MDIKLLLPIIILELILKAVALFDLFKRNAKGIKGENKWIWLFIIICFSTIGPIVYLFAGKKEYIEE